MLPIRSDEEHPFLETIRVGVLQYRLQSASRFNISVEVNQTKNLKYARKSVQPTPSFRIEVLFHDFSRQKLCRVCRLRSHNNRREIWRAHADDIQIQEPGGYVSLYEFLSINFPVLEDTVNADALYAWWNENGRVFEWKKLPTELKERIIRFCMHRSYELEKYLRASQPSWKRYPRRLGPYELTDQLGEWSSLLRVSYQVRAIALRLCFVASSDMASHKGLCIVSRSYFEFADSIRRLGKYFQLVGPNSVPVDDKTLALAEKYKHFPRIFPQLKQYATLCHGIRRIHLQMSFLNYFHFFKVTTARFEQYWRPYYLDYAVLERLPHLTDLIIKLPDPTGRLDETLNQPGPPLFYDQDFACPRILHRIIYEQVAELLVLYENVEMYGFMDGLEAVRFKKLRSNAIQANNFTRSDLDDLYADDEGGVELEEDVIPGISAQVPKTEETSAQTRRPYENPHNFWPPKCRCTLRCKQLIVSGQCGHY